jgi:hypothetical protein
VANLQAVLSHNDPLDEQLQDRLLVLRSDLVQPTPDMLAEGSEVLKNLLGMGSFLTESGLLFQLLPQGASPLLQLISSPGEFLQIYDIGLVCVDQAALLAGDSLYSGLQLLGLGTLLLISLDSCLGKAIVLSKQSTWICQKLGNVIPDCRFQFLGFDGSARTGLLPRAQDAVLAVALVVAPLGLCRCGFVGPTEHGQTTDTATQQTAKGVVVLLVVAERESGVASKLGLGKIVSGLVDDGGNGNGYPFLLGPDLAAAVLSNTGSMDSARLLGRDVAVAVGVGNSEVGGICEDAVDGRGRPWALA